MPSTSNTEQARMIEEAARASQQARDCYEAHDMTGYFRWRKIMLTCQSKARELAEPQLTEG